MRRRGSNRSRARSRPPQLFGKKMDSLHRQPTDRTRELAPLRCRANHRKTNSCRLDCPAFPPISLTGTTTGCEAAIESRIRTRKSFSPPPFPVSLQQIAKKLEQRVPPDLSFNCSAVPVTLGRPRIRVCVLKCRILAYVKNESTGLRPALRRPRLFCGPTEETAQTPGARNEEGTSLRTAQSCRPVRHACSKNRL